MLVVDPMLATGHSAIAAVTQLRRAARADPLPLPDAAPGGIAAFDEDHPDVPVFTAAIDAR